jgi:hypothetical protein
LPTSASLRPEHLVRYRTENVDKPGQTAISRRPFLHACEMFCVLVSMVLMYIFPQIVFYLPELFYGR